LIKAAPPLITEHLTRHGFDVAWGYKVTKFTGDTRFFHDIGSYGDNAVDDLTLIQKEFEVDFSPLPFKKYFPGAFGWEPLVLTVSWNSAWASRIKEKYSPITLDMLEEAIHQRKWIFD